MKKWLFAFVILWSTVQSFAADYVTTRPASIQKIDLTWRDEKRNREVPVRIYAPKKIVEPIPVVVFSHGLGGSREMYVYFGEYISSLGYVVVHPQHHGTDFSMIQSAQTARLDLIKATLDPRNTLNRIQDMKYILDQMEKAQVKKGGVFEGKLDLKNIAVAGHSFGSLTAMVIAGESFVLTAGIEASLADPRVKAAIAMSSPVLGSEKNYAESYAGVKIPVFHMTGSKDDSPIGETSAAQRRIPYDYTQNAESWLLNLNDAQHSIFSGRTLLTAKPAEQDKLHLEIIKKMSAAFLDAQLKSSETAKKWLQESAADFAKSQGKLEHKKPANLPPPPKDEPKG